MSFRGVPSGEKLAAQNGVKVRERGQTTEKGGREAAAALAAEKGERNEMDGEGWGGGKARGHFIVGLFGDVSTSTKFFKYAKYFGKIPTTM